MLFRSVSSRSARAATCRTGALASRSVSGCVAGARAAASFHCSCWSRAWAATDGPEDRSIGGIIPGMVAEGLRFGILRETANVMELDPISTSLWLNDRPCTVQKPGFGQTKRCVRSLRRCRRLHFLPSLSHPFMINVAAWDGPQLRASSDHRSIVGAWRGQRTSQAASLVSVQPSLRRIARCRATAPSSEWNFSLHYFRRWSGLSSTARVEGAPFHRAASASKEDDPDYLPPFFILIPSPHLYRIARLFEQLTARIESAPPRVSFF